jgi:alkylation response protein AidB-like acyl-CoA dehydrogenase
MGFGLLELCVLLQEIGRAVAPVPVFPTLVLGGRAIAQFGSAAQQARWLPAMAAGDVLLSAALVEPARDDPGRPETRAREAGSGWLLNGRKSLVPAAHLAQRVLIPAATEQGVGLFLLDPKADGVTRTRQTTSTGEPLFDLQLADAGVEGDALLGGDPRGGGAEAASRIYQEALVALCATQLGVAERALEITTGHVRERVQFGVPIGSFQAVQHRTADCYTDLEAMRWTTWRAAWKLAEARPASRETAVAKFWAAEGGSRIVNAAQHLHGGLGVDLDYPIHRYFLWSKALELGLGAATPQLARLGRDMARSGPQELA